MQFSLLIYFNNHILYVSNRQFHSDRASS